MKISDFLLKHSPLIQAAGSLVTAMAAVLALVVVPWQIHSADQLQQAQSARDIYRDFLNLTVQKPELATLNLCEATQPSTQAAYEAYVSHMLYTAEQVLQVSTEWQSTMQTQINQHRPYICSWDDAELNAFSDEVADLLKTTRQTCSQVVVCPGG
jgi:hypothetical protein